MDGANIEIREECGLSLGRALAACQVFRFS